jgi:DNA-binding transcriptional MocR family regulator
LYCYNPTSVQAQYQVTGRTAASISDSLEEHVRGGRLAAGDLLPPIRRLADELGVSPGTIAAAYRLLGSRGLTVSDRRRGTRVRPLRGESLAPARVRAELPPGVVDCSTGNPDPALLPDAAAALRTVTYAPATYGSAPVHGGLRAVALQRFAADGVPGEEVACTFGALDAIGRVLASNLSPGDRVAVEDPGWAAIVDQVERMGYVTIPVAVDREGPEPEAMWQSLAGGASAVVVTSRAHNPTGAAITAARSASLRAVLARYPGRIVIEDDHACGLVETPLHPVVGTSGRHAFVRSVSKGYGPDLRFAAVTGDPATMSRLEASIATGASWVSYLVQQIVLAMWQDGAVDRLLRRASTIYRERRQALSAALRDEGVEAVAPTGLNLWIPVGDEATAVASLLAAGWLVAPGSRFRLASPPAIRVTTARLPVEQVRSLAADVATARRAADSRAGSGG